MLKKEWEEKDKEGKNHTMKDQNREGMDYQEC